MLRFLRRALAPAALVAAVFFANGAQAQTVSCSGPTGANCVPVVLFSSPSLPAGSGNAGYPPGSTPVVASFSGANTASNSLTIPAVVGKFSYVCGIQANGLGATAATSVTPTVTGMAANLTYTGQYTYALGAAVVDTPFERTFTPCLPSQFANVAISFILPGAAGNTTTNMQMWGYQQ